MKRTLIVESTLSTDFEDVMWSKEFCFVAAFCAVALVVLLYLARINRILNSVPVAIQGLTGSPWTKNQLKIMYDELEMQPPDYTSQLPPRLDRRYIVTGGNGTSPGTV